MTASDTEQDQARLPVFRLLLAVQALATVVFGLVPLAPRGVRQRDRLFG
jgi:hypothetical protein